MLSNLAPSSPDEQKAAVRLTHAAQGFQQARTCRFTIMVGIGNCGLLLKVENGAVTSIENLAALRPLTSWDFSVKAETDTWLRFWEALPSAGWHDLFALTRNGRMHIEGDLHPFMSNLQLVKNLLASPRLEGNQ